MSKSKWLWLALWILLLAAALIRLYLVRGIDRRLSRQEINLSLLYSLALAGTDAEAEELLPAVRKAFGERITDEGLREFVGLLIAARRDGAITADEVRQIEEAACRSIKGEKPNWCRGSID